MKKLFFLIAAFMLTFSASAQVTWNLKLGGGMSSFVISNSEMDLQSRFVGKVGVGMEMPFASNWSLMPSLEFAMKGTKGENENIEDKIDLSYIQVPVVAAYRFNLNDRLNMVVKAGPYFAYALSGNEKVTEGNQEWEYDIFDDYEGSKRFEVGIDAGVDFEIHRFVVGVEYERGFTNIISAGDDADFDIKNQAFYVTLGYKF